MAEKMGPEEEKKQLLPEYDTLQLYKAEKAKLDNEEEINLNKVIYGDDIDEIEADFPQVKVEDLLTDTPLPPPVNEL